MKTDRFLRIFPRAIAAAFGTALWLGIWSGSPLLASEGFSGLVGKRLSLLSERSTIGESFRTGGTRLTGSIARIVVVEDTETRLRLQIHYSGYEDCTFNCHPLDGERRAQKFFQSGEVASTSAQTAQVDVIIDLEPSYNRSQELASEQLEVRVERRTGRGAAVKYYALSKRWRTGVAPEFIVIPIVPKPVGDAVALNERPPGPAPDPTPAPVPNTPSPAPASPHTGATVNSIGAVRAMSPAHIAFNTTIADPAKVAATPVVQVSRGNSAPLNTQATKQHILHAILPANELLAQSRKLHMRAVMPKGLAPQDVQRGAQGPSMNQVNLLERFRASVPLRPADLSAISLEIYQDRNPRSGIYYFRPNFYNLAWAPDSGYGMRMVYKASATEGQAGELLVAARLESGVDSGEIQFVKDLVAAYRASHPNFQFTELRALPIDKEPEVSLSSGLQRLFDIPPERIALTALSDALAEMEIGWVSDTTTGENLKAALVEDVGINGKVSLSPTGGGLSAQDVPVQIKLADNGTFGVIPWQRSQRWRNPTLYPIRLKYLHALVIQTNTPIVYTWALGDAEVPSRAQAEFQDRRIPAWLDAHAKRFWLQYSVVSSDSGAQTRAVESITGGAVAGPSQLFFRTLRPLADTAASHISVRVRSRFFHPRNRELVERAEVLLDHDDREFPVCAVYDSGRSPSEPLIEYTLSAILPDGSTYSGQNWLSATNGSRVFIGRVQVEQATGNTFGSR